MNRKTKHSIDEMMIAYKERKAGNSKQYMKDKPNKWGFKYYVRAEVSGIIYDFILYGGIHSVTIDSSTTKFLESSSLPYAKA